MDLDISISYLLYHAQYFLNAPLTFVHFLVFGSLEFLLPFLPFLPFLPLTNLYLILPFLPLTTLYLILPFLPLTNLYLLLPFLPFLPFLLLTNLYLILPFLPFLLHWKIHRLPYNPHPHPHHSHQILKYLINHPYILPFLLLFVLNK